MSVEQAFLIPWENWSSGSFCTKKSGLKEYQHGIYLRPIQGRDGKSIHPYGFSLRSKLESLLLTEQLGYVQKALASLTKENPPSASIIELIALSFINS